MRKTSFPLGLTYHVELLPGFGTWSVPTSLKSITALPSPS
jgi:hypothetical protein